MRSFITGTGAPNGIAVDGQHPTGQALMTRTIGRANLDGSGADQSFISTAAGARGVAVDGQHVYWSNPDNGTIGRAGLDGSGVNQSFITGAQVPNSLAVDGQHIYWGDQAQSTVGRANLDGSGDENFIEASQPFGVAVDAGPAGTATASSPSLSFPAQPVGTFATPQAVTITNTGHGVLEIDQAHVTSPATGDFLISADTCSGASVQIGAACTIHLRFGPTVTGTRSSALTVSSNDTAGPLQIALAGTGSALVPGPVGPPGPFGAIGLDRRHRTRWRERRDRRRRPARKQRPGAAR